MANIFVTNRRTKCVRGHKCELWILCLLLCIASLPSALTRSVEDDTVSVYPEGDIYVLYGDNLTILCTAGRNYTSNDLVFMLKGNLQESEIVNSTTIKLFKEHPRERLRETYYCRNNKTKKIALASVYVASPPKNVKNFKCVSKNLEILNCSWTTPDFVFTNYTLTFLINDNPVMPCEANVVPNSLTKYCSWNTSSTPMYRQQEETYYFSLVARNAFGNKTQNFVLDHFSVVKPDPPMYLKNSSYTAHSVLLHWEIPNNIFDFLPDGVEHKIEYQIAKIDNTSYFRSVNTSGLPTTNKTYKFNLTELPYAHMKYGVRVYIKPKRAKSDEFWSDFNNLVFYTASERPRRPPDMIAGGFDQNVYDHSRMVYVYWKQLEEYEEAGANFTYKVVVMQGSRSYTYWPEKDKSLGYLNLRKATLEAMQISVWSYNEIGQSVESSHLYIPPERETGSLQLTSFTKLAYENGTYELSWVGIPNIDNYTLFWCHHNATDICNGRINFATLDSKMDRHVINLPRDYRYQFAISANYGTRTSGMIWAKCDISKDAIAMYGFPISFTDHDAPGKTFVKLKWSMECTLKEGIITGYNITYCPVLGTSNTCNSAVGSIPPIIINDTKQMDINVTGLRSYTTYQFKMTLNTIYGLKTIENTTVRITTSEDTPTTPRNIIISDVKSDSLIMSWDPPLYLNGHISKIKYEIFDAGKLLTVFKYEDITWTTESRIAVTLEDLHSFTNYSLAVQACNVGIGACSNRTAENFVRTRIGKPSRLKTPAFVDNVLTWNPPEIPGGVVDEYQIKVVKDDVVEIVNTTKLDQVFISCEDAIQNEVYQVRAVNYDEHTHHGAFGFGSNVILPKRLDDKMIKYYGDWSDEATVRCKSRSSQFLLFIIMGVLALMGFACGVLKIYKKIRKMGDIKPEFPKGLFVPEKDISKYPFSGLYPSEKDSKPTSDEMLLLPNSKCTTSSPEMKQIDNDNCGSSDHTDSTALSEASQVPIDRQNSTSDDDSHSSLHLVAQPIKANDNAIQEGESSNSDTDSSREDSPYLNAFKKNMTSGYVQPIVSPVTGYVQSIPTPVKTPPSKPEVPAGGSSYVMAGMAPSIFTTGVAPADLSRSPLPVTSGYVRQEDIPLRTGMNFPKLGPSPTKVMGPESLPIMPILQPPTKHGVDSSYIQLQSLDSLPGHKPTVLSNVPSKPPTSSGYVSPGDAVITKHLKNIMSGAQPAEESAILDPAMSPDAYCRFSWSIDPANDNLHSLLANPPTINPTKN